MIELRDAKEARKISNESVKGEKGIVCRINQAIENGREYIYFSKRILNDNPEMKRLLKHKGYKIINYTENSVKVSW